MWDQDGGAQQGPPRDQSVPTPQDPWEALAPDPWPSAPHGIDPSGPAKPPGPRPVEPTRVDDQPQPGQPGYVAGRARVPKPVPKPTGEALHRPTSEMPQVRPGRRNDPPVPVSWHRPSRERLRSLSDGWGFTATGLMFAFIGWGIWAASVRDQGGSSPLLWFIIVCAVGVGVFTVCRLVGRVLVGQVLRRPRQHARWAHAITGLYLTACGLYYLGETEWGWVQDGVDFVKGWFD